MSIYFRRLMYHWKLISFCTKKINDNMRYPVRHCSNYKRLSACCSCPWVLLAKVCVGRHQFERPWWQLLASFLPDFFGYSPRAYHPSWNFLSPPSLLSQPQDHPRCLLTVENDRSLLQNTQNFFSSILYDIILYLYLW